MAKIRIRLWTQVIISLAVLIHVSFSFAESEYSSSFKQSFEQKIARLLAAKINSLESTNQALSLIENRLSPNDTQYVNGLIKNSLWVELPHASATDNMLTLRFSNKQALQFEITNYWQKEFKLNGYPLKLKSYSTAKDQIEYLKRVISMRNPSSSAWLFEILIPSANATMTCNAVISSGCMEVSMATSLWLVEKAAEISPLQQCKDGQQYLKGGAAQCLKQFETNPTLKTIQNLSEILARSPRTSLELNCHSDPVPEIFLNGEKLLRVGERKDARSYLLTVKQNPDAKLSKLPELALQCCQTNESDPLGGECENFVNNYLGDAHERQKEFNREDLRIRGKKFKSVK